MTQRVAHRAHRRRCAHPAARPAASGSPTCPPARSGCTAAPATAPPPPLSLLQRPAARWCYRRRLRPGRGGRRTDGTHRLTSPLAPGRRVPTPAGAEPCPRTPHSRRHRMTTTTPTIDAAGLRELIAAGHAPRLLDVRTPGEFETAHIPGAYNVPLDLLREHRDGAARPPGRGRGAGLPLRRPRQPRPSRPSPASACPTSRCSTAACMAWQAANAPVNQGTRPLGPGTPGPPRRRRDRARRDRSARRSCRA